jgi:hypothetical protein
MSFPDTEILERAFCLDGWRTTYQRTPMAFATPASDAAKQNAATVQLTPVGKLNADLSTSISMLTTGLNAEQLLVSIEEGFAAGGVSGALKQVSTDAALIIANPTADNVIHAVIFIYLLTANFVPALPH